MQQTEMMHELETPYTMLYNTNVHLYHFVDFIIVSYEIVMRTKYCIKNTFL